jgi:hypothetical protein
MMGREGKREGGRGRGREGREEGGREGKHKGMNSTGLQANMRIIRQS